MTTFSNVFLGATPNDKTGTPLRNSFEIINQNFASIAQANGALTVQSVAGRTGNVRLSVNDVTGAASTAFVNSQIASINTNLESFETYANVTYGTGSLYSNVNVSAYIPTDPTITALDANIGAFQTYAKSTVRAIDANIGAYQTYANSTVRTIDANIGAYQTYANSAIHNFGNAVVSKNLILDVFDPISSFAGPYALQISAQNITSTFAFGKVNEYLKFGGSGYSMYDNKTIVIAPDSADGWNLSLGGVTENSSGIVPPAPTYIKTSFITDMYGANVNLTSYANVAKLNVGSDATVSGIVKADDYRWANGAPLVSETITVSNVTPIAGNLTVNGNLIISGNLIPSSDITYDLGSATNRWRDLYLSGSTIYLGNTAISTTAGGGIATPVDRVLGGWSVAYPDHAGTAGTYTLSYARTPSSTIYVGGGWQNPNYGGPGIPGPGGTFEWVEGDGNFTVDGSTLVITGDQQYQSLGCWEVYTLSGDSISATTVTGDIVATSNISTPAGDLTVTGNLIVTGDLTVSPTSIHMGNLTMSAPDGNLIVNTGVSFTMANYQNWSSNVSTVGEALDQLAERLKNAGF